MQQTWSCKFEEMKCWSRGNNKKTCHDLGRKPKCRNKITSHEKKPWRRIYICASKLNKTTSKNPFQIYTIPFHLYETDDRSITQSLWNWGSMDWSGWLQQSMEIICSQHNRLSDLAGLQENKQKGRKRSRRRSSWSMQRKDMRCVSDLERHKQIQKTQKP